MNLTPERNPIHGQDTKRIRRGLVLVIAGLLLQLLASFYFTPGTFVIAAALGLPLVLLGVLLFGYAVTRIITRKGAL